MPSTNITDNTKVVILREYNLTVGLNAHEGVIFLVDAAYNVTINLKLIYRSLTQDKLCFELSKALSQEVNGYLPLADFPSNEMLKKAAFEKLYGIYLDVKTNSPSGKDFFITSQGPIYLGHKFYSAYGDLYICRPSGGDIYITRIAAGNILKA
jgi:hypothetical protein